MAGTGVAITNPLVLYRSLIATQKIRPDPAQHRLGNDVDHFDNAKRETVTDDNISTTSTEALRQAHRLRAFRRIFKATTAAFQSRR